MVHSNTEAQLANDLTNQKGKHHYKDFEDNES